jgi:tRNA/rRNA methyltransferase
MNQNVRLDPARFSDVRIILARPRHPENIGLVARAMKNTGFMELSLVLEGPLPGASRTTAVHAEDILERARCFTRLAEAVADVRIVFAAVARHRKNFPSMTLEAALTRMGDFPPGTRIGLLFGNERTGLSSRELLHSNFRFTIPQAAPQPSYNLASAVLLTLFAMASASEGAFGTRRRPRPLSRRDQEAFIRRLLNKLEQAAFIHEGNRRHVAERMHDLFGRLALTVRDRDLLLAIFDKARRES